MRKRTTAALAAIGLLIGGAVGTGQVAAASATGGGHHAVTICHQGHTITVDKSAVPGHLRHGDKLGECCPEPSTPVVTPTPEPTEPPVTETPEPTVEPTPPVTETPTPEPTPTDEPTVPPTDEPTTPPTDEPTTPPVTTPPATETPEPTPTTTPVTGTPSFVVRYATCERPTNTIDYELPTGLFIDGVGSGSGAVDGELLALVSADDNPYNGIDVLIAVEDGYSYDGPLTVHVDGLIDPATLDCATPTPTPTDTPTPGGTPSPTDTPTPTQTPSAPVIVPTPTGGTTPPASSTPVRDVTPTPTTPVATASVAPVAADTSTTPDRLAYTGLERGTLLAAGLAAVVAIGFGAVLLTRRTRRRRAELNR